MSIDTNRPEKPRLSSKRLVPQFMGMMLLYCGLVYAWLPRLHPLGRDYAALASPETLPWLARDFFSWEVQRFGAWAHGYYGVNLLVLYACMVTVFFFTRLALQGPWWLGSLAAVLMMANPLKSEAVLHLSGIQDLLPAWMALLALLLHALHLRRPRWWTLPLALALFAVAMLPYRANQGLIIVVVTLDFLITEKGFRGRSLMRLIPYAGIALVAAGMQGIPMPADFFRAGASILPLWLVFYPIGLLPTTAALLYQIPALAALAGLGIVLLIVAVYRVSRHVAALALALAACAWCVWQSTASVDLVHMRGGGGMIVPMALMTVAFAGLCGRIQRHPKWRLPIVFLTTLLCAVFFALQARSNLAWMHAGDQVRAFQAKAAEAAARYPGETLGIAPDFQYHLGAPMRLSESVQHDTLFSAAVNAMSVFPINYAQSPALEVTVLQWAEAEARIAVRGATPEMLAPHPYALMKPGSQQIFGQVIVGLTPEGSGEGGEGGKPGARYCIRPVDGALPLHRIE